MEFSVDMRDDFSKKVREGVKSLIKLNELDDLEDFDAGLYISNVFEKNLKENLDLNKINEAEQKSIRAFLWSAVYSNIEIEKYENYIKKGL